MAVVHVTNFTDFLTAVTVAGDIVVLDNDIDGNSQELTSTVQIRCAKIDGAGHTIYNIQCTRDIYPLRFYAECTVHNCNFNNVLQTAGGALLANTERSYLVTISNCAFQGLFTGVCRGNFYFTRCAFVLQRTAGHAFSYYYSGVTVVLEQCYFKCDNISSIGVYFSTRAKGCYFEGTLNNPNSNASIFDGWGDNSVYNIYVKSANPVSIYYGSATDTPCIYNADRVDATITVNRPFIALTDEQMHSAAEIAAVGFDIIV